MLTAGCTKKEDTQVCLGSCTTVVGRLVTSGRQQRLLRTTVEAQWHYGSGLFLRAKSKVLTTSDANGNYRLTLFAQNEELADGYFSIRYLAGERNCYIIDEPGQALHKVRRNTAYTLPTYLIPRKAFVQLSVPNPAAVPPYAYMSDFNTCYGANTAFSRQIQGSGSMIFWDGLPIENPLPVAGGQPILVREYKDKNGLTKYTTDSLFIPAGTTCNYSVTY